METKSFILVVGSMKQICLNCDKTFYVSEGSYRGYPQWFRGHWDNENDDVKRFYKHFHKDFEKMNKKLSKLEVRMVDYFGKRENRGDSNE